MYIKINMIIFQKKVVKYGKERLMIEVPKELRNAIRTGDTVTVSKREFPITPKDLHKLYKKLKGKHVELSYDLGILTTEGYLKETDDTFLKLSDKEGENTETFNIKNARIISLQPKIILRGHYINGRKVTEAGYKKALARKEFSSAQIVDEDIA